jgi:AcrR family transcriptional regulator
MARPRDPRADEAILSATIDVLVESGFGRLTVDAVAARAGVGKATIYRRWSSKERMVLSALAAKKAPAPTVDTGALRSDLVAIYEPVIQARSQETTVRLMPALAVEAANDDDVRAELRRFVDERRKPTRLAFARAVERGDIAPDTDVELCIDLLTGMTMNRIFFTGDPVDETALGTALDIVLRGIGAELPATR